MPYVRLRFSPAGVEQAIAAAAERFQQHSPFLSQLDERAELGCHPFHITLVAGIRCGDERVQRVLEEIVRRWPPASGRFERWHATSASLQLIVADAPELHRLTAELVASLRADGIASGTPWRPPYHVTVGSMRAVDSTLHRQFLDAAEAAFPITAGSVFTCDAAARLQAGPLHVSQHLRGQPLGSGRVVLPRGRPGGKRRV